MDQQRFDRLTASLASGTGRRRAIAGLLAGTALLGRGVGTSAKKRKKKCTFCPQRFCCQCKSNADPTTKCLLIDAPNGDLSLLVATDMCAEFCDPETVNFVNGPIAGTAHVCGADNACQVKDCPIKVK